MLVLIVEEESDLAQTCARLLQRRGHAVTTAPTQAAALQALAGVISGLVVCDVCLPDGDGLEVVRAAKRLSPPAAAIVMTGQPSTAGRQQALASGADAYLMKPFSVAPFAALVERALDR